MPQRIIYRNTDGGVSVIIPADCGLTVEEIAAKDVPAGTPYEIIDAADQPDRTFRAAWRMHGKKVREDLTAAVEIAHEKRRDARSQEFAPLDLEATIPSKAETAEAKRQAVRDKYAKTQSEIDAASDVEALRGIVKAMS